MIKVPKIIVESDEEPVTLAEAWAHLNLDVWGSPLEHPQDNYIQSLITVARQYAEEFTGLSIVQRTMLLTFDAFPVCRSPYWSHLSQDEQGMSLGVAPLVRVLGISYLDGSGDTQWVTDYQLDDRVNPARLYPASGAVWPTAKSSRNAVSVVVEVGYGNASDSPSGPVIPKTLKQAILLMLGHWFENREDASVVKMEEIPLAAQTLLRRGKIDKGMA